MKVEHNTKNMTVNERAAYWLEFFNKSSKNRENEVRKDKQDLQVSKGGAPGDNVSERD
jgi:hypothetical protein